MGVIGATSRKNVRPYNENSKHGRQLQKKNNGKKIMVKHNAITQSYIVWGRHWRYNWAYGKLHLQSSVGRECEKHIWICVLYQLVFCLEKAGASCNKKK